MPAGRTISSSDFPLSSILAPGAGPVASFISTETFTKDTFIIPVIFLSVSLFTCCNRFLASWSNSPLAASRRWSFSTGLSSSNSFFLDFCEFSWLKRASRASSSVSDDCTRRNAVAAIAFFTLSIFLLTDDAADSESLLTDGVPPPNRELKLPAFWITSPPLFSASISALCLLSNEAFLDCARVKVRALATLALLAVCLPLLDRASDTFFPPTLK
mmetsp:Transcript_17487/g.44191  ORF Transcript_17487/g.44191 Transcript_17487/m.44191 type:complete len:215 (-) Transcript_17487:827-1471(-)